MTDRLSGPEIDGQLEARRLRDRHIERCYPTEQLD